VIGVLSLYQAGRDAFSRDQLRVLQIINAKVALAIENALKFEQVEASATIDYVTSLPNARSLFVHLDEELARCDRSDAKLAVVVCDVDDFKCVNDRFGHNTGNRLLGALAREFRSQCRSYDHVARMGGDEFVLVMPGATREAVALRMQGLEQVTRNAGLEVCGEEVINLSCGDAYFPEDGRTAEELMDLADRRMYRNKRTHKEREPAGQAISV
jgi:diguanylate cyclase (GGDEF)-like protein